MSKEVEKSEEPVEISKGFKEKLILLAIGTFVTLVTVLISNFVGNFVTQASYNEDKAIWGVVLERLDNIEDNIEEIKKNTEK